MTDFPLPELTPAAQVLLDRYAEAVAQAPKHFHLTSEAGRLEFRERHLQDALWLLKLIEEKLSPKRPRVLDVGTGNGIPGVPFGLARPDWMVDLIDSDTKKALFIDTFCKSVDAKNLHMLVDRAETVARSPRREGYDIVVARALAKLPTAIELAGAFVVPDGWLIVSHGTSWQEELARSGVAIKEMGLSVAGTYPYWPQGSGNFQAIFLKKTMRTPDRLPRAVGIPTKRPL